MDWTPIAVAIVTATATLGAQFLIARREPAAIRRLAALNEAINGMPAEDEGRILLELARTHVASRLSAALTGLRGFARALQIVGWTGIVLGSILLVSLLALLALAPDAGSTPAARDIGGLAFVLLLVAPVVLAYSKLWPAFERDVSAIFEALNERRRSKKLTLSQQVGAK